MEKEENVENKEYVYLHSCYLEATKALLIWKKQQKSKEWLKNQHIILLGINQALANSGN